MDAEIPVLLTREQALDLQRRYGFVWPAQETLDSASEGQSGRFPPTGPITLTISFEPGDWPREARLVLGWDEEVTDEAEEKLDQLRGQLTAIGAEVTDD